MAPALKLTTISCSYRDAEKSARKQVVSALSLTLEEGEIGCLLGASGCGKTTTLRAIAGFQPLDNGDIWVDEQHVASKSLHVATQKRRIGMVFQDYALFPHLTVSENICFGIHKQPRDEQRKTEAELLNLVQLDDLAGRYPHELSGGQQQRVALARALAPSPKLLLLDEPLSNLDTELRRSLAIELRDILKARRTSALMVTHDQQEAFAFADKAGVMQSGQLDQWDTPYAVYHKPATRYVARFIGQGAFIAGTRRSADTLDCELGLLRTQGDTEWPDDTTLDVLLRPDDVIYDPASPYRATVTDKVFAGTSTQYGLALESGRSIKASLPSHEDFKVGDSIAIRVAAEHVIAFAHKMAKT